MLFRSPICEMFFCVVSRLKSKEVENDVSVCTETRLERWVQLMCEGDVRRAYNDVTLTECKIYASRTINADGDGHVYASQLNACLLPLQTLKRFSCSPTPLFHCVPYTIFSPSSKLVHLCKNRPCAHHWLERLMNTR